MDKILEKIIDIVSESLVIEKGKINLKSLLVNDLGIDSLDFLDIVFMIEKEFKIKVRDKDFDKLARLDVPIDGESEEDHLSKNDIEKLSKWIPDLKKLSEENSITRQELYGLLTIESVVLLVDNKLKSIMN
ncbi:MAG: phosphopantetheine-binding protein [Spirochaetota bacterium]|nr:phosphopantetheine-binding protein [Spirochaetota bacterium]